MENALNCILASLLRLSLSVLLANLRNNGKVKELIIQYCYIVFQTLLLLILSSLHIAFCSVVYEMDCMDTNWYDVFHLEYCFVCHGAPALTAFPSILLLTAFIYFLPSNPHSALLSLLSLLLIEVSSCYSSFLWILQCLRVPHPHPLCI